MLLLFLSLLLQIVCYSSRADTVEDIVAKIVVNTIVNNVADIVAANNYSR